MNDLLSSSTEFFHPASSVQLALPEAARALEQAWQRRRQELGSWQPSGGWLIDQNIAVRRTGQ
jgi:hypothetical protein